MRDSDGTIYVLEDNLRVPSGVSYMLENRLITKRVSPNFFNEYSPLPVDGYPSQLFDTLCDLARKRKSSPEVAVLTPASITRPISNTPIWRSRWGANW